MAHPYHHSLSSMRKWGGEVSDYLPLHSWFDLMWTGKSFFSRYSAEVVVPVVHRRGGACGPTGASTGPCAISPTAPLLRMGIINGRELRVAPQFEFPLWVESGRTALGLRELRTGQSVWACAGRESEKSALCSWGPSGRPCDTVRCESG